MARRINDREIMWRPPQIQLTGDSPGNDLLLQMQLLNTWPPLINIIIIIIIIIITAEVRCYYKQPTSCSFCCSNCSASKLVPDSRFSRLHVQTQTHRTNWLNSGEYNANHLGILSFSLFSSNTHSFTYPRRLDHTTFTLLRLNITNTFFQLILRFLEHFVNELQMINNTDIWPTKLFMYSESDSTQYPVFPVNYWSHYTNVIC